MDSWPSNRLSSVSTPHLRAASLACITLSRFQMALRPQACPPLFRPGHVHVRQGGATHRGIGEVPRTIAP